MTENNFEKRHFGDPQAEYSAAINSAVVFDVSNRVQLELIGPDRNAFLHNFCTNNINAMATNTSCEAFLLNAKGRMLGYVTIHVGENNTWVDSVPGQGEFLHNHLAKYHLLEDFQLEDRSTGRCEFFVVGPQSASFLKQLVNDAQVTELVDRTWKTFQFNSEGQPSCDIDIRRCDLLGQVGFSISLDEQCKDSATLWGQSVWDSLTQLGVHAGGCDVLDLLRIEHAIPDYGSDLTEENLAQEANRTARAISFEKGCYLGQEPVARLNALGHVNRAITRFTIKSDETPLEGTAILNPDKPEKEIGKITSIGWSWERDCAIGLGLLRTQFGEPGTQLPLAAGGDVTVF
jgi:tRNA-modifying protein YgfZ